MGHRRKFILVPAGSAGDIHPFVWLGKGLVSLGHEVVAVVHRPFDRTIQVAVPTDLAAFLDAGEAPVLFTPGSANVQARRFFEVGVEACRRLRLRALFVTPYTEQLPSPLPPEIRHVDYAPFSQVFPRCAALVHHGGIGTVAQGLAAGVPQLVMAMSHDQPDNGYRLTRLGVGAYLYPKAFTPDQVADALARLTSSPDVTRSCRAYHDRMHRQMPAETVFHMLEEAHRTACG